MSMRTRAFRNLLALAVVLTVAGCGGGGGSDAGNPAPPPVGGIDRGGVAVGPIGGFGSVIVNGVEFDTSNAVFTVDGGPAGQDDLAVGQVVLVKGEIDDGGLTGTADSVGYDAAVEGPIAVGSLDQVAQTFRVMGVPVRVTATTVFDDQIQPRSLAGLAEGNVVEVSGLPDADGFIRATRIDLTASDVFELKGFVANLDTGAFTFELGSQTVDYSMAQLDDFGPGGPANGDFVEAKGEAFTIEGALFATRVQRQDELSGDDLGEDGDDVDIEGYVNGFRSPSDFDVLGIRIRTDAATRYQGGTAADIALNVRLQAEGHLQADGSVLADEIEFRPEGRLEASARVEAVDSAAGTFTVLGIQVLTDANTSFEDKLLQMRPFGLGDIRVGDWVEVRGLEDGQGDFLAQQVERDDPENEVELRGTAEDVNAPGFTILGVTIVTNASTEFEGTNEAPITAQQFFDAAEGRLVEVDGTWDGAVLTADQASLKD